MDDKAIADVTVVAAFLVYAEKERLMLGGHRAHAALESFSRIIGMPVEGLRRLDHENRLTEEEINSDG